MNERKAIEANQNITLKDISNDFCTEFTIEKEIGRGASCIVYEASYKQNGFIRHCRLKEFFPIDTNDKKYDILRNNNLLAVQAHSRELFEAAKNSFIEGIKKQISFYETISEARNQTAYIGGIYAGGDSIYCTMLCDEGESYDKIHEERLIDILKTAKAIAVAVSKYHSYTVNGVKKAILHLDIKPSNVFILNDTREIVKLFDYDSVIFKEDLNNADIRLSGSKGYMPYELEKGKTQWISEKTDIYSIGAIVFERIMGRCVNNSVDKRVKSIEISYRHPLFIELPLAIFDKISCFFKKTCCCGLVDRYDNIEELIAALDELIEYAQPIQYSLMRYLPSVTSSFIGREAELERIDAELEHNNYVILSGMAGIGKTELALKYANCAEQRKKYKSFFVTYQGNIKDTILSLEFNNFQQYCEKNGVDFEDKEKVFKEKVKLLAAHGNASLLIVDNMDSADSSSTVNEPAFAQLVSCGIKLIITSRNFFAEHCLSVGSMYEEELLRMIDHDETNVDIVKEIIKCVDYHTLAVDLIGKTIRESWGEVTPKAMLELLRNNEIDNALFDEVTSTKDKHEISATLYGHIKKLFKISNFSKDEKICLRDLALFKSGVIDLAVFLDFYGKLNKPIVEKLSKKGWISIDLDKLKIRVHPIIKLYVNNESCNRRYSQIVENMINEINKFDLIGKSKLSQILEVAEDIYRENILITQLFDLYLAVARTNLYHIIFNLEKLERSIYVNTILPLPSIYSFKFLDPCKSHSILSYRIEKFILEFESLVLTQPSIDNIQLKEAHMILSYYNEVDFDEEHLTDNKYIKKLLENSEHRYKDNQLISKIYACIGDACSQDNNYKIALINYKRAIKYIKRCKNSANSFIAYVNLQLGKSYYRRFAPCSDLDIYHKKYTLKYAIKHIKESLKYQDNNCCMRIYTGYVLIKLLLENKQWNEAIIFVKKELATLGDSIENTKSLKYSLFCLQTLCTIYQMQGKFKDALIIKLKYLELNQGRTYVKHKYYKEDDFWNFRDRNRLDDGCKDYDELGKLYEHNEDYESAIAAYEKSISFYTKKRREKYYLDDQKTLDLYYFPQFKYPGINDINEKRLKRSVL